MTNPSLISPPPTKTRIPKLDLCITIANLGCYKLLKSCLQSIYEEDSRNLSFKVIVGFNGFDNLHIISELQRDFPLTTHIYRRSKLGYCGIYNLLVSQIDARYTLLLDDDTIIPKGTLPVIVKFMDNQPSIGITGCRTLNPDNTFQKSFGVMYNLQSELLNAFHISSFWPDRIYQNLVSWKQVDWLNGSFMLVRRDVLKSVGGLDEHYYTYQCEADWCYRITKAGWKVAYLPDVFITHVGGDHSINTSIKHYSALIRAHKNRFYFFHKHFHPISLHLLRPLICIGALLRFVKYLCLYIISIQRRPEALPKIEAFLMITLFSFAPKPYSLSKSLQKENDMLANSK